jgi:hypothetical protein
MNKRFLVSSALLAIAVSAVGLAQGGMVLDEGWESGTMATFNSNSFGRMSESGQYQPDGSIAGRTGNYAIRHRLTAGMPVDSVDSVTQHFGDASTGPVLANGQGQHFYDLYLSYRVYYSSGFDFGSGHYKQFIYGTQDNRRHDEACCVPFAAHYLTVLVERGGVLQAEAYNKQSGTPRFDINPNTGGYNDSNPFRVQSGRWYSMEVRRRLNDAGADNGIFQMWVDGQLIASYNNVRFRIPPSGAYGSNFTYGTNFAMMADYTTYPVSRNQDIYYDDVRLSTARAGSPIGLPSAPTNLRIIPGAF